MKANLVPADFTDAQSILPCHRDTSMPCTGRLCARATLAWGFASLFSGEYPVGWAQEASASAAAPSVSARARARRGRACPAQDINKLRFGKRCDSIGSAPLTQHTAVTHAPKGVNRRLTGRKQEVENRCTKATWPGRGPGVAGRAWLRRASPQERCLSRIACRMSEKSSV